MYSRRKIRKDGLIMKSIDLKTKFSLLIFILLTTFTLVSGYFIFENMKNQISLQFQDSLTQSAIVKSEEVVNLISSNLSILQSLATSDYLKSLSPQEYANFIDSYQNKLFSDIEIIDSSGHDYASNAVYNRVDNDFFNVALKGRNYLGDIFRNPVNNKYYIDIAVPVMNYNQVDAVIRGVIDADKLSELINKNMPYENSYAYILNNKTILAHKTPKSMSNDIESILILGQDNKQREKTFAFFNNSLNNNSGYGEYLKDGKPVLAAYNRIRGTNWKIYVTVDKSFTLTTITAIKNNYIAFSVIVLSFSLLIAFIVSTKMLKPIGVLSKKFIEASEGKLGVRSDYQGDDEIGTLSQNFNFLMDKLNKLTFFDRLTGLPNSNILHNDITRNSKLQMMSLDTIILISINKFSEINETHGLETGDKILVAIANRLSQTLKTTGKLYKGKGDEFFILLRDINQQDCEQLIAKIHENLSDSFTVNKQNITPRYAIGLFHYNTDLNNADTIINNVIHANNISKQDTTIKWRWYNEASHASVKQRKRIENAMFKAIDNNEMFLVFQPIVNIKQEKIAESEVLLRWHNSELGMIPPETFIRLAEENGFIRRIDHYVFEESCKQLAAWENNIVLSINVSSLTFESSDYIDFISDTIKKYNVNPAQIQIELTERLILNKPNRSIAKMQQLQNIGFRIALDDFGVGYSSLSYLVKLPINLVKIDRSFIHSMDSDNHSNSILNAIINMCQTLNLSVVAEGVETQSELNYLRSKNLELIQGYYFSEPISRDDFQNIYIIDPVALEVVKKL